MGEKGRKGPLVVMISSTALDLPEHRQVVLDACLRLGMMPRMMEHLPASDAEAVRVSLEMVDEADIYVGVFAHRYGYVPKGRRRSITELEYERARKRDIPRLIFLMHDDHPIKAADVEKGSAAERLEKLKERLGKERVVEFFKSPDDLKGQVIHALGEQKTKLLEVEKPSDAEVAVEAARSLHPSVDIPAAPGALHRPSILALADPHGAGGAECGVEPADRLDRAPRDGR